MSSTQLYTGDPARLAAARTSAPPPPAARAPGHLRSDGRRAGERQPGTRPGGTCANRAEVRSRRRAPRQPAAATRRARARSTRHPAPSVGAPAADHAAALWQLCCAALVTTTTVACPVVGSRSRALPPHANGHDGGAWNRAASERWAPRSPGQPASRLHPHALRRAAFDNFGSDRRGLRARHADTHAQLNTHGARGLKVRRSPSNRPPKPNMTIGPGRRGRVEARSALAVGDLARGADVVAEVVGARRLGAGAHWANWDSVAYQARSVGKAAGMACRARPGRGRSLSLVSLSCSSCKPPRSDRGRR